MSNRLLAFLILFVVFGILIGGYLYLFVYYTGSLVLKGNMGNYDIKFHSDTIKRTIERHCDKNICEISGLPPLDLTYTIKKEGYKEYIGQINIPRNGKISTTFLLKKETILVADSSNNSNKTTQNKIQELRDLGKIKDSYSYFDMGDLGIYYFEENSDSLALYNSLSGSISKIYDVSKVAKEDLKISLLYSDTKQIFIEAGDSKYIYDILNKKVFEFEMKIAVKYVKSSNLSGDYQIVTDKGTFLYNSLSGNLEYFAMFSDFVYCQNNSYIGIIYSSEDDKKKNYGIEDNNNLVIMYNPISKDKKILMNTSLSINKIIYTGENIYVYDSEGKKYLLKVGE